MKYIRWRILVITCLVCLLPIFLGVVVWDNLPDTIAIHFNFNNEPDNFAPKDFVVFGLPLMMACFQLVFCGINDFNSHKHGESKKVETATKLIIPIMAIVLQIVTLGYALGWNIDIRKSAALIVGVVFLVTGNYLPKLNYVKNYNIDTEKARKINRFMGVLTVVMGILMLITIALPPIATVAWLILLIPYAVLSFVYTIRVIRSK